MKILKRDDILKELQTLLGLRGEGSASGDTSALENSLTEGIIHCWRYRDWSWAIKRGSTELVDGHYLLPEDFDKRSPDNMILSVALKYKGENPIVLTSDNGLQLKSKALGLSTISLKSFLKR